MKMIEYYGWVCVREGFNEANESEEMMGKIWQEFLSKIDMTFKNLENPQIKTGILNGNYQFMIFGFHNHKSQEFFDVLEIYQWLAKNAVGSYGLLHYFDDEDKAGFDNQFQVYSLKNGKFECQQDKLLSPYFNEIEDRK